MRLRAVAVLVLMLASSASAMAQQPQTPDPELMRAAVMALQSQRNRALDEAADAEAKLTRAQMDSAKLSSDLDAVQKQLVEEKAKTAKVQKLLDDAGVKP